MPVDWFELGNWTPKRKPTDGQLPLSLRTLILVHRVKSPVSFVEFAAAARSSGIELLLRELIDRKFCATPSISTSTLGARPIATPSTPARVRSPSNPETG